MGFIRGRQMPIPDEARVIAQETLDYFAGMKGEELTEMEAVACLLAKAYLEALEEREARRRAHG